MIRALLVLVSILAACTFPSLNGNKTNEIPDTSIPESPAVEVISPRKEVKPRKPVAKPTEKPAEPELINPVEGCANVDTTDPVDAARAKLNCMQERLKIEVTE